jgi:hypothetical protein
VYRIRPDACASAVFAGLFFFSSIATAADVETGVGLGMEYSDNAALAADNEVQDLIVIAGVGAKIDAGSGPFRLNANTTLRYQHYTQDTFRDQQYFNLGATVGWEMLKGRVDWEAQDFFSQRSINAVNADTPDNIQDTNVFTFGPNIYIPISARQSITLQPEYRLFTYEVQNINNQQKALDASWNYKMFQTMKLGLVGGVNKVDYDEQTISDNKFSNFHLTVSGIQPRSNYHVKLGLTRVGREGSSSVRGLSGDVTWALNLTGSSNVRAHISSGLTDSNRDLLNASKNPENGDFSNQQISAEVLRNSITRLAYNRADATLKSSVWSELRRQDYEQTLLDRDVQVLGVQFDYSVTATVSTGVYLHYTRTELTDIDRKDNQYTVGGSINYSFSRKLNGTIDLRYREKDSDLDTEDFTETSMFVNFVYGYGRVARAINRFQ